MEVTGVLQVAQADVEVERGDGGDLQGGGAGGEGQQGQPDDQEQRRKEQRPLQRETRARTLLPMLYVCSDPMQPHVAPITAIERGRASFKVDGKHRSSRNHQQSL